MSLSEAASSGSRIDALRSLRDIIAATIDEATEARDVASLSRQMTDVLAQIEQAEKATPDQKGTVLDELKSRRAAREPSSSHRARA